MPMPSRGYRCSRPGSTQLWAPPPRLQSPFGDAKPREVVIAQKVGKTEEEVLKEEVSKEKLHVSRMPAGMLSDARLVLPLLYCSPARHRCRGQRRCWRQLMRSRQGHTPGPSTRGPRPAAAPERRAAGGEAAGGGGDRRGARGAEPGG